MPQHPIDVNGATGCPEDVETCENGFSDYPEPYRYSGLPEV